MEYGRRRRAVVGSAGEAAGTAIAGLSDQNGDGYGDVAIGAPYGGTAGHVYLILGAP